LASSIIDACAYVAVALQVGSNLVKNQEPGNFDWLSDTAGTLIFFAVQMVLLTIAIAGGPFLGLLGTVVGVMITFAAVAEAGDVNINAIAPGIAAALLATVAGLAVAIPALFGYNYLLAQIEDISTEDQIFVDQLEKQIAERFS
jgi:biopolymer transport protein ExbB